MKEWLHVGLLLLLLRLFKRVQPCWICLWMADEYVVHKVWLVVFEWGQHRYMTRKVNLSLRQEKKHHEIVIFWRLINNVSKLWLYVLFQLI